MDAVAGGYAAEMHMEMEAWCETNCRGTFVVVKHDEIKFSDKADAEAFAYKWFAADKWRLRKMIAVCDVSRCKVHHDACTVAPEGPAGREPG